MAHIGLLEDNARIARLCATMLQYAGHQVVIYQRAHECLQALLSPKVFAVNSPLSPDSAGELPVDVLILDLHLPDIDGLEVLYHLNAHPQTRTLPLIFCTAAPPAEIAKALHLAPHASFIEKPFTIHDLTNAITNVLHSDQASNS